MSVEHWPRPENKNIISNLARFLGELADESLGVFRGMLHAIIGS